MKLLALHASDLMSIAAQIESGVVHRDIVAKDLRTLVLEAKSAVPLELAQRLALALRCRCVRNYDMDVTKQCGGCAATEELRLLEPVAGLKELAGEKP